MIYVQPAERVFLITARFVLSVAAAFPFLIWIFLPKKLYELTKPLQVRGNWQGEGHFMKTRDFMEHYFLWAGFFLPWIKANNSGVTAFGLLKSYLDDHDYFLVVIFLLIPAGALIVFLQSLTNSLPRAISGLFKWLAFISLVMIIAFFIIGINQLDPKNNWTGIDTTNPDISMILKFIGVGLWLSLFGSIIILFNRTDRDVIVVKDTSIRPAGQYD